MQGFFRIITRNQLKHTIMVEVWINGSVYYADIRNKILYIDREKKNGTPFSFMTKNELEQMEREIRFPRSKKKEEEYS